MDHQQWLEWRRGGIGSSDAPIIMGVSPWKTKYQLWEEKVFGFDNQEETPSMSRGKELEEVARREFEKLIGVGVFPRNVEHRDVSWMRASLDGIDLDGKIMVEIKCPNKSDHLLAVNKKVPAKYMPQCQHQLMVTGLDHMFYFSFDGKNGEIVEVKRDSDYLEILWKEEHKFWELKVQKTPPEMCDRDFIDQSMNSEWNQTATHWATWKKILKQAEEKEAFFKDKLTRICGNKNSVGAGIKLSRSISDGRIDTKKIMQDYPEIPWESYRKESFEKITITCV